MTDPTCIFCEKRESATDIKHVWTIGLSGICNVCAALLREALGNDEVIVE